MAGFDGLMLICEDARFQARVRYAMHKAALDVMAEAATVLQHAQRVAYAKAILNGMANVEEMAIAVLNNATIAAGGDITKSAGASFSIVDSDIQFAVNSNFNAYAGVAN